MEGIMTRQNKVSVKCVENMLVIERNREYIRLESMQVYRSLSVCSVENKLAVRIDEINIRNMGFRKNSIRRKTRENKKSLGIVSHYVTVLIFWLIDPVSQSSCWGSGYFL